MTLTKEQIEQAVAEQIKKDKGKAEAKRWPKHPQHPMSLGLMIKAESSLKEMESCVKGCYEGVRRMSAQPITGIVEQLEDGNFSLVMVSKEFK